MHQDHQKDQQINVDRWFGPWLRVWGCGVSSTLGFGRHHDRPPSDVGNMVVITPNIAVVSPPLHPFHATYTWRCFSAIFSSIQPFMHADIDGMILCRQGHKWIIIKLAIDPNVYDVFKINGRDEYRCIAVIELQPRDGRGEVACVFGGGGSK
jgi:hypothetical protein